jgi:hypothetical protein
LNGEEGAPRPEPANSNPRGDLARRPHEPRDAAGHLARVREPVEHRLGEHLGVARLGARQPLGGGRRGAGGLALGVEQDRVYVNSRDPVDEAVVAFPDDGEAVALEAVDEP